MASKANSQSWTKGLYLARNLQPWWSENFANIREVHTHMVENEIYADDQGTPHFFGLTNGIILVEFQPLSQTRRRCSTALPLYHIYRIRSLVSRYIKKCLHTC